MASIPWLGPGVRRLRAGAATTPGRLRLLAGLVTAGSGLLWIVGAGVLLGSASALEGIGRNTVPAIVLTQQVHAALAAADRSAANAFLSGGVEIVEPRTEYEIDLATATADLETAAEQNRAGARASAELQAIGALLTQYTGLVEQARANNRQGFPIGVAYLRDASDLMHRPGDGILARVDAVGALNAQDLAGEDTALTLSLAAAAGFLAVALAVMGLLVHTQVFVSRRFNRQVNDGLLAATAGVLLLTVWMGAQVTHTAVAAAGAQEAYARVHDLWLARSIANDADGAVSLSLAAPDDAATFDRAFAAGTAQLVDRPLTDGIVTDAAAGRVEFGGLLAVSVRDARTAGEREAALRALRTYRQFLSADAALRESVARGDQNGAVAIALGTQPGQLAVVFGELDEALGDSIAIDQAEFAASADAAGSPLGLDGGLPALAVATALLTLWGLSPRLAEYRL
jgi:hypothetical protein